MRINGFRCDECGKEHLLDPTLVTQELGYSDLIPVTWLIVTHGNSGQKPDPWDRDQPWVFCSRDCLYCYPFLTPPGREDEP